MHDMPQTLQIPYRRWIRHFPASYHSTDHELFYLFVKQLLHTVKKQRDSGWLEKNMREDRPDLSDRMIEYWCGLYTQLRDFEFVGKSHTNKLIAADGWEEMKLKAKEQSRRSKDTNSRP